MEDKLQAAVYEHSIRAHNGVISCWSYVSSGLSVAGQREVVFTLRRSGGRTFPEEPLQLIRSLWDYALAGQTVEHGGRTEFGDDGFMNKNFRGIIYVHAQRLSGMAACADLSAILVSEPELRLVESFGPQRLLALLGFEYRFFPYPTWNDLTRQTVVTQDILETMSAGPLAAIPQLVIPYASAVSLETELICMMPRTASAHFLDLFESGSVTLPFSIRLEIDPSADSCLVWQYPGSERPLAISRQGSTACRLSGSFLTLTSDPEVTDCHTLEDGFVVRLAPPVLNVVMKALSEGVDICVPATSGGAFRLQFFNPATPASRTTRLLAVNFLNTEEEVFARVNMDLIGAYMKRLDSLIEAFFQRQLLKRAHQLKLSVVLEAGQQARFNISSAPEMETARVQELISTLQAQEQPACAEGSVGFEMVFAGSAA